MGTAVSHSKEEVGTGDDRLGNEQTEKQSSFLLFKTTDICCLSFAFVHSFAKRNVAKFASLPWKCCTSHQIQLYVERGRHHLF